MYYICRMSVIYIVTLVTPYKGSHVFTFGSLAAIYDIFTHEVIGVRLAYLYACGVATGHVYSNRFCSIQQHYLVRKKTKRGKKHYSK